MRIRNGKIRIQDGKKLDPDPEKHPASATLPGWIKIRIRDKHP
jgi:hypothetical protein